MTQSSHLKNMSTLIEINHAVSRSLELRDSLQATLQILLNGYKIKSGAIFLADETGQHLDLAASIAIFMSASIFMCS